MAGKLKAVVLGKGLLGLIQSGAAKASAPPAAFALLIRKVHTTTYDKNVDEAIVQPTVVPDHVIGNQPKTFWGPNPETGVFGPGGRASSLPAPAAQAKGSSILDQEAWFRHVEDIDKPAPP